MRAADGYARPRVRQLPTLRAGTGADVELAKTCIDFVGPVDMLRAACEALTAVPQTPATAWLGAAIGAYLSAPADRPSLDRLLGLAPEPGARSWQTIQRHARRDEALRRLAADHFPSGSCRQRAAQIRERCERYEAAEWRRADRMAGTMPESYRGTIREYLYTVAANGGVPQDRQLRSILKGHFGQ